jgi:hypothetical protein
MPEHIINNAVVAEYFKKTLDIYIKIYGENHMETVNIYSNYMQTEEYDDAKH